MSRPHSFLSTHKQTIAALLFGLAFSVTIAYATPPGSPYSPGETLDPNCAPGGTNCSVLISGGSSQWTTIGSDIYYDTGKVGVGLKTPNGPFQAAELQYNAGTASQSGTAITGVGTTWTNLMVGSEFIFANGARAMITGRSSDTSLTVDFSQTVSSQAYGIYYAGLSMNNGTGDISIGSIRNPASNSRLFIYGGSSGANVDARGTPGMFEDISQFEAEGNDYDISPNSVAIRYFGSTASGAQTIMGYDSNRLGMLDFINNTTSLIRSNTSIQFGGGISDLVTMTLDPTNQRLGIGVTSPSTSLDVLGGALVTLGSGDDFTVVDSNALSKISMDGSTGLIGLGDTGAAFSGDAFYVDPLNQVSYFTNTLENTKVGINTPAPVGVFDVSVGVGFGTYNNYLLIDVASGIYRLGQKSGGGSPIGGDNEFTIDEGNDYFYARNSNNTSKFGINTTTPTVALDVSNTTIDGNIFALRDSDGTCLYNPEAGSVTVSCSSDQRLKNNIVDTDSALTYFSGFQIRDYNVIASGDRMTGVIAQEVLSIHPELVTQGLDGMYSVQLPNQWKVIKAIQELDIQMKDMTTLTESDDVSFVSHLRSWLSNAGNKVTRIFTGEICLTDPDGTSECINKQELHQLKGLLTQPNTGQGSGSEGESNNDSTGGETPSEGSDPAGPEVPTDPSSEAPPNTPEGI